MEVSKVQAFLGIVVVLVGVVTTAIIGLTPVVGGYPTEPYTEHLKIFGSVYGGIIGIVIGFFFGKQSSGSKKTSEND